MFDTLVVTKRQKRGAMALLGLPAAVTLHVALGTGFFLFSLYSPVALPAPPAKAILYDRVAIPVTFVQRTKDPIVPDRSRQVNRNNRRELQAPPEVPPSIPTSPPEGPPGTPIGPDDPNTIHVDFVLPGEDIPQIAVPSTVPVWTLVEPPHLLVQVRPDYPRALEMARVSGKVVLKVLVDETGAVAEVNVVSSPHPLLSRAAEEAVRQWKYSRPLPPGGGMARVEITVVVDFKF